MADEPHVWIEADLGDTELVVREHADGMFTIDMPEPRLVAGAEHMEEIARGFVVLAKAKGWT